MNILPVNGVYHIVLDGETIADLAERYDVESTALDNDWNDLGKGQSLSAGMALVIPSGKGGSTPWPMDETGSGGDQSSDEASGPRYAARNSAACPGGVGLIGPQMSGEYWAGISETHAIRPTLASIST